MLSVYGLELRVWDLLFGVLGIGFRVYNTSIIYKALFKML